MLMKAAPLVERKLGRKITLTLTGAGAALGSLREVAQNLPIVTEFTGWLDGPATLDLMRRVDLLVVPSLWPEPFGLVGIEAGSVGLPAAGFAVGGIPDWLIAGQTGELAPADPPTVEGLAEAIVRAIRDPEHYGKLCRGAFEFSQQFTLDRHVNELEAILYASASKSAYEEASITRMLPARLGTH